MPTKSFSDATHEVNFYLLMAKFYQADKESECFCYVASLLGRNDEIGEAIYRRELDVCALLEVSSGWSDQERALLEFAFQMYVPNCHLYHLHVDEPEFGTVTEIFRYLDATQVRVLLKMLQYLYA